MKSVGAMRPIRPRCTLAALALAFAGALLSAGPARAAETIHVNGSGSALDLVRKLIEAYTAGRQDAIFHVDPPLGTSGAIQALLAGGIDLAAVSRPVTPQEAARGARGLRYGVTPLVLVTSLTVKRKGVARAELEKLWAGEVATWDGHLPVRVVLRPESETNTKLVAALSPRMAAADAAARRKPWAIVAVTDPEATELVARTPGAIGAATLTATLVEHLPLNVLALDGVAGTVDAVAGGRYPLAKEVVFVTSPRTPPAARALVAFAVSSRGRAVAAAAGVLVTAGR